MPFDYLIYDITHIALTESYVLNCLLSGAIASFRELRPSTEKFKA